MINLTDIFVDALLDSLEKTAKLSKQYLRERGGGDKLTKEDRKAIQDADITKGRRTYPRTSKYGIPLAITGYGAALGGAAAGKKGALIGGALGAGTAGLNEFLVRRAVRRHEAREK